MARLFVATYQTRPDGVHRVSVAERRSRYIAAYQQIYDDGPSEQLARASPTSEVSKLGELGDHRVDLGIGQRRNYKHCNVTPAPLRDLVPDELLDVVRRYRNEDHIGTSARVREVPERVQLVFGDRVGSVDDEEPPRAR